MNHQQAIAEAKNHLRQFEKTRRGNWEVRIYAVVTEGGVDPDSYNYRFDKSEDPIFQFHDAPRIQYQETISQA